MPAPFLFQGFLQKFFLILSPPPSVREVCQGMLHRHPGLSDVRTII